MPRPVLVILVGIPGSGKSTFSRNFLELARNYDQRWIIVSQDELGDRSWCERVAENHLRVGGNVIIDRCNINESQRQIWIRMGWRWNAIIVTLYFSLHLEICLWRVSRRRGHPTLDSRNSNFEEVVRRFWRNLELPDISEGVDLCMTRYEEPDNTEAIMRMLIKLPVDR